MPWFRLTAHEPRGIRGVGQVPPGGLFNSPHSWWGSKRGYEPLADDHPDVVAYLEQGGGGLPPWAHVLSLPYPNAVEVVRYHTGESPERAGMEALKAIYDAHKNAPDPCPQESAQEAHVGTEEVCGGEVEPFSAALDENGFAAEGGDTTLADASDDPAWEALRALTFTEAKAIVSEDVGEPIVCRSWADLKEAYDAYIVRGEG